MIQSKLKNPNYTSVNNIPWLFNNPDYYLLYWQAKAKELLVSYSYRIRNIEKQKNETSYLETKTRLDKIIKAYEYNLKKLESILNPLFLSPTGNLSQFSDMIPSQQTLSLYWNNIFRDWAWQTTENSEALAALKSLLGNDWTTSELLILGSGSCRLTFDFHQHFKPKQTYALDFNPLLLFIAKKMQNHEDLKFYEIPFPTIEAQNITAPWILKNPFDKNTEEFNNVHLLFGDIQNLPFKESSFASILTPWVIDILPMEFEKLAERINLLLPTDGEWINFGPLGFMHSKEAYCHSKEEIVEILTTKGFVVEKTSQCSIPYLNSPHSSQKRTEEVLLFKARKKQNCHLSDYTYLPPWLLNRDIPIPITDQMRNQQALAKTTADVFFSIDGKQSFNDLAKLLSNHYQMSLEQAQQTLMLLFIKFHESQARTLR